MTNNELNARLAEWIGKCLHVYGDNLTPDPLPKGVQFIVYHRYHGGGDVQSVTRADGSLYRPDTDPAAALELLGWVLRNTSWTAVIGPTKARSGIILSRGSKPWQIEAEVHGPSLTALPRAIAKAVDEVRKQEEGDDEP